MERFQLINNLFSAKFCRTFEITSPFLKKILTDIPVNPVFTDKISKNCMKRSLFFDFRIDNSGKWCYISKMFYIFVIHN